MVENLIFRSVLVKIKILDMRLKVTKSVIDLEKTLFMGQAFRWHKKSNGIAGVIGHTYYKLEQDETHIRYQEGCV